RSSRTSIQREFVASNGAVRLHEPPDHMSLRPHATTAAGGHNTIVLQAEPPKDHIIWSLCSFFYFNPMCLGLAALIFSIKSRDRKVVGDLEGARHYGATARYLNIAATIIVNPPNRLFLFFLFFFFFNTVHSVT
uniref:Uncharacterized protein n=1 Tax=Oryzias latipes TaxID=8090 RepID=A0A3B3H601_ORYLA